MELQPPRQSAKRQNRDAKINAGTAAKRSADIQRTLAAYKNGTSDPKEPGQINKGTWEPSIVLLTNTDYSTTVA